MPRKFLQRFLPHADTIKKNKYLRIFGKYIHAEDLWHLHRRSVAKAVAIGFFTMFMPMPFQMVLAVALAIIFRANILLSAVTVWISNPLTMGPMLYFAHKIGSFVFHTPPLNYHHASDILKDFKLIWKPLLLGSVICGLVSATIGYIGVTLIWRWNVTYKWTRRQAGRKRSK